MKDNKKRALKLTGIVALMLLTLTTFIIQHAVDKEQALIALQLEKAQILLEQAKAEQSALAQQLAEIEFVSDQGKKLTVCAPESTFKSYMDYRAITDTTSAQYQLLQQGFTVGIHGILVQDGRFLVAMSDEYGPVGTDLTLTLDGVVLRVRIADTKHTGCTSADGSMLEFVVDVKKVHPDILKSGNFNDLYNGKIEEIEYE